MTLQGFSTRQLTWGWPRKTLLWQTLCFQDLANSKYQIAAAAAAKSLQ